MSGDIISQTLKQTLSEPPFNQIMSKNGRQLRDNVYSLCFVHGLAGNFNRYHEWIEDIKSLYDPLNFECAVLFDYSDRIFDAIRRHTSKKFKDDERNPKKSKNKKEEWGTIASNSTRIRGYNWLELIKFINFNVWYDILEYPKATLSIDPKRFQTCKDHFRSMYDLITKWHYSDFNRDSLFDIHRFANNFDITFVQDCMNKVEDPRKHTTRYLNSIMETEHAILRSELEESVKLTEFSKDVIKNIMDSTKHHEPVNWDNLKKDAKLHISNNEAFNKVKLS